MRVWGACSLAAGATALRGCASGCSEGGHVLSPSEASEPAATRVTSEPRNSSPNEADDPAGERTRDEGAGRYRSEGEGGVAAEALAAAALRRCGREFG